MKNKDFKFIFKTFYINLCNLFLNNCIRVLENTLIVITFHELKFKVIRNNSSDNKFPKRHATKKLDGWRDLGFLTRFC